MKLRARPRAGRHADRWFQDTYRAWRRKVQLRLMLAVLIVVPPVLLFGLLWDDYLAFCAGLALGAAMAMYMCLIDSPPEWIERKRRGRDGERRTEKRLRGLEREGWGVAHDIERERGNFDHLIVGPGGAYLLETKDLSGCAKVENGRLTLYRGDDERDSWHPAKPFDAAVRAAGVEARNRLRAATGIRWVQGVIVLWSEFPQQVAELDRVFVVHGDHLTDWLRARPQLLQEETLAVARGYLADLQHYEIAREGIAKAA